MTCAAARSSAPAIRGSFRILKTDSFPSFRNACEFNNVDARIAEAFLADPTKPDEYCWEAFLLGSRPAIIEDAMRHPECHFGIKQLMAWEARAYCDPNLGIHRVAGLRAFVGEDGEELFPIFNRNYNGLKTACLATKQILLSMEGIYYLRIL